MRNFLLFISGNPLIALSDGGKEKWKKVEREKKKKVKKKRAKTKTALAALADKGMCCWHCRSHRLSIKS